MARVPVVFRLKRTLWCRVQAVAGLSLTDVICRSLRAKLDVVEAAGKPCTTPPGRSQPVRVYLPAYLEMATRDARWMIAEAVRLHMADYTPTAEDYGLALAEEKALAEQQVALEMRMAAADAECDRMLTRQREQALREIEEICRDRWDCSVDQMDAVYRVILRLQGDDQETEKE